MGGAGGSEKGSEYAWCGCAKSPTHVPHQPEAWGPKTLNPMVGRLAGEGLQLRRGLFQAQVTIAPYCRHRAPLPRHRIRSQGVRLGLQRQGQLHLPQRNRRGGGGGWGGWTCLTEPRLE